MSDVQIRVSRYSSRPNIHVTRARLHDRSHGRLGSGSCVTREVKKV
jgi:hypothetical protein